MPKDVKKNTKLIRGDMNFIEINQRKILQVKYAMPKIKLS